MPPHQTPALTLQGRLTCSYSLLTVAGGIYILIGLSVFGLEESHLYEGSGLTIISYQEDRDIFMMFLLSFSKLNRHAKANCFKQIY